MDDQHIHPGPEAFLQGMVGYLNFSEGRPDPRFQKSLNELFASFAEQGAAAPWQDVHGALKTELERLKGGEGAFRNASQAEAVLLLVFERLLPAYRQFHADLLFHQTERDLWQPFFLARAVEAVLAQAGPWDEESRILEGAQKQLNDFAGHRPVALLETRPQGEPYPHEKVRPIPLYLRGVGVAWGRYRDLVARGLEILAATDGDLLEEACFHPDRLEELAFDPRDYDFHHPVNRRPNYVFGEWDPYHLDKAGNYSRYIARQVTLEALLDRVEHPGTLDPDEVLTEAAVVFAGTLLMATATSGRSPSSHDSTTTLATLVPQIALLRDNFYARVLERLGNEEPHAARLVQEAAHLRQPFGGARQHYNAYLARQRALQLQQRQLALIYAEMGFPEASREEADHIHSVSVRFLSEVHGHLSSARLLVEKEDWAAAGALFPEVEDFLKRGIDCGGLADPWNILGFQGLFPIFPARQDAVRDQRVHELNIIMERLFGLYARLLSGAAADGYTALVTPTLNGMQRLAAWWDRFATSSVGDLPPVQGSEAVASSGHVAAALAGWNDRDRTGNDLAFWRDHLEGFQSAKSFALVIEPLLQKKDFPAAMGLLVNWLGQADRVPLEDGPFSFHSLALRWMLGVSQEHGSEKSMGWALMRRFIEFLEANAEHFWEVPALEGEQAAPGEEEEDSLYEAAYEGVIYQDTTDDSESEIADGGQPPEEFLLEIEAQGLIQRLRFLSTLAHLWHIAAGRAGDRGMTPDQKEILATWLNQTRKNRQQLLLLLDAVGAFPVPEPVGTFEALVEYDRRRLLKEQLLHAIITTCLETEMAGGVLEGRLPSPPGKATAYSAPWGIQALRLERAILSQDPAAVRQTLPPFLNKFREEALLFQPLSQGGKPRQILRVRLAQNLVQALVSLLPRLGLVRETFHVLRTAQAMERNHPPPGHAVTEFNGLFQAAFRGVVACVLDSSESWGPGPGGDGELVGLLHSLTMPFLGLWISHSLTLQLATLETVRSEEEWSALKVFIRRYGGDLFDARFLALANLRGILHHGISSFLDYQRDNPDPLHPLQLVEDLDRRLTRQEAVRHLQIILQTVVENYEEYRDFNSTTMQSDYGNNLYVLLDFLRLKASYERQAWNFKPLMLVHDYLVHKGRGGAALLWEEQFQNLSQEPAANHLARLTALEQEHHLHLGTVADRLQERFIEPLAQDRLCALVEPAMEEAPQSGGGLAFQRLREEVRRLAENPSGVGLDVPPWLRRLAEEIQRVRAVQDPVTVLAQQVFHIPQRRLEHQELLQQLAEWDQPPGK